MGKYTPTFFIKFFEDIPEEKWTINTYKDHLNRKCALGHCNEYIIPGDYEVQHVPDEIIETAMSRSLKDLFNTYLNIEVYVINDERSFKYPQSTPKQRILAALIDIARISDFQKNTIS